MDKEQRKRMAYRTVIQSDEGQSDIEYTVQVSGDCVELHQTYNHEWENEDGTGPDISHEVWVMNLDTFKEFIRAAEWCVEKSEAFDAKHALAWELKKTAPYAIDPAFMQSERERLLAQFRIIKGE